MSEGQLEVPASITTVFFFSFYHVDRTSLPGNNGNCLFFMQLFFLFVWGTLSWLCISNFVFLSLGTFSAPYYTIYSVE